LHAVEGGSLSADQCETLERVVELERVFADTAPGFAMIATVKAIVRTSAAERWGAADRRVPALDPIRLAGTIADAFINGGLG
jgi:hypothetical protein